MHIYDESVLCPDHEPAFSLTSYCAPLDTSDGAAKGPINDAAPSPAYDATAHAVRVNADAQAMVIRNNAASRWRHVRKMMKQLTRGLRKYSVTSVADMSASGDQHKEEDEDAGASMLHKDFWLEALDDQHRYGFHLRAFHRAWKDDMARRVPAAADASFFHWLDHGRGRYVELPDCSQHALRSTHVQYCDEQTRRQYEVRFVSRPPPRSSQGDESVALEPVVLAEYVATGKLVHTDDLSKWIFVIDLEHKMYLARKRKGVFHHSSFVAGAPIFAAGKIMIQQGQIIAIEPHSGHFKPTLKNLTALVRTLRNQHVDLDLIAFIRPKKWSCAWPFLPSHLSELEDLASDTDYCYKSDSDETDGAPNGLGRR